MNFWTCSHLQWICKKKMWFHWITTKLWTDFLSVCALSHPKPRALPVPSCLRDDAFSDNLSQKADSEASSGPLLDDKSSSKNDLHSPCETAPEYNFSAVMGRWDTIAHRLADFLLFAHIADTVDSEKGYYYSRLYYYFTEIQTCSVLFNRCCS